ncbi:MAG: VWA domain-containing protein [Treponemataceae bacterium]|nr:MAG: VWA domain-containing protein [Treponemataceae bacterium]
MESASFIQQGGLARQSGFAYPAVLALALLVPLFFILQKKRIFSRPALNLTMADWDGSAFIWKSAVSRAAVFLARFFASAAFLLSVAALADPIVTKKEKVYASRGTDILFVLDTSPSMAARDISRGIARDSSEAGGGIRSRFEAAREIIMQLAHNNSGQTGLVSFATEAVMTVPVTSDKEFFSRHLGGINIGELGNGSAIGTGLALAVYHLASDASRSKINKCVILLTDGENNRGSIHPLTAARLAQENSITFYVAGLGTKGRVPLEYVDPITGAAYSGYLDSRFDESALRNLAAEGGGLYFAVTTLKELEASLASVAAREQTTQQWYYRAHVTRYYGKFLFASVLCAVSAWIIKKIILKESL